MGVQDGKATESETSTLLGWVDFPSHTRLLNVRCLNQEIVRGGEGVPGRRESRTEPPGIIGGRGKPSAHLGSSLVPFSLLGVVPGFSTSFIFSTE